MSTQSGNLSDAIAFHGEAMADDGKTSLAIAAGIIAALVSGAIWAALVLLTNLEIGYVAWGIGLLVGFAMARVTTNRSKQLAYVAAALAIVGLLSGKAMIFIGSSGKIAEEFEEHPEFMTGALAWNMYAERELDAQTLEGVDNVQAAGDTLSDALWAQMTAQASAKLQGMTEEEKREFALTASGQTMQQMGMMGGIRAQLTMFDALWLFLAVGTAFRIMSPAKQEPATSV